MNIPADIRRACLEKGISLRDRQTLLPKGVEFLRRQCFAKDGRVARAINTNAVQHGVLPYANRAYEIYTTHKPKISKEQAKLLAKNYRYTIPQRQLWANMKENSPPPRSNIGTSKHPSPPRSNVGTSKRPSPPRSTGALKKVPSKSKRTNVLSSLVSNVQRIAIPKNNKPKSPKRQAQNPRRKKPIKKSLYLNYGNHYGENKLTSPIRTPNPSPKPPSLSITKKMMNLFKIPPHNDSRTKKLEQKYGQLWKKLWIKSGKKQKTNLNNLENLLMTNLESPPKPVKKKPRKKDVMSNIVGNMFIPSRKPTSPVGKKHIRNVDPTLNMNQMYNLKRNPVKYGNVSDEPNDPKTRLKKLLAPYLSFRGNLATLKEENSKKNSKTLKRPSQKN